jgi:aminomethyltransferase
LEPIGLAARNTLRLEAGLLLYGNDMDETTSILEANLGWICKLQKGDFVGRQELLRQRDTGVKRILAGFEMIERGIARDHYIAELNGEQIGIVTSGSPAPFLKKNIGFAYLPVERAAAGNQFSVVIREKPAGAQVVPTPFYRRAR